MIIRRCAGIDVGLASAAAAVYGYADGKWLPSLLATTMIPTVGEYGARRIDEEWLWDWLVKTDAQIAYVENATAMPDPNVDPKTGKRAKMGAGSMARYLRACGSIEATVKLAGLERVMVMPGMWQKAVGLTEMRRGLTTDSQKKNCSVVLARALFPEHAETTFKFYHSHNLAEASIIALYAAMRCDIISLKAA